jgi:hypothetical protein
MQTRKKTYLEDIMLLEYCLLTPIEYNYIPALSTALALSSVFVVMLQGRTPAWALVFGWVTMQTSRCFWNWVHS